MRKLVILAAAMLLMAACSPQVYNLYLDVRQPSRSGFDLSRKSMAIAYMDSAGSADTLFDHRAASAMARVLESDYFGGEEVIQIYRIPEADSVSVDLMHSLVMDTNRDVVFVLNSKLGDPIPPEMEKCSIDTRLDVYDSMGKDKVRHFKGSSIISAKQEESSETVGQRIATRFLSEWKTEGFSLYYFDDFAASAWERALVSMYDRKFTEAIDTWGTLLTGSALKRACASYNIAMAFYLLQDYELAARWLDQADKLENLSQSPALRKRIASHLEKTQK